MAKGTLERHAIVDQEDRAPFRRAPTSPDGPKNLVNALAETQTVATELRELLTMASSHLSDINDSAKIGQEQYQSSLGLVAHLHGMLNLACSYVGDFEAIGTFLRARHRDA